MIRDEEMVFLPCKKCGSTSIDKNRYPECFYLSCDDCGYTVDGYDQKSTLALWNRRKGIKLAAIVRQRPCAS